MMFKGIIAAVLAALTHAQTEADILSFPNYASDFDSWNVTWEAVKVKTEDGWTLTVFHITGDKDTGPFEITKPPLLMQHGMGGNGTEWTTGAINDNTPMAY